MKTRFSQLHVGLIAGVVLGVALVVLAFARLTSAQATAQGVAPAGCDPARSLQVSGSASINVVPDRAAIQLGIVSNAASAEESQAANLQSSQAVIGAIKALGIEPKDIVTDGYDLTLVYADNEQMKVKGYRTTMMIVVTLRDPSKTRDVLVAATRAGANTVGNVEFSTTELRKYRDEARTLALQAAKEKAELLTSTVGASTGCVLSINEGSQYGYSSWYYNSGAPMGQNVLQNAESLPSAIMDQPDDSPISLGQIAVSAEVSVTFALR
jgi:uncharacterized protein YggE